MSFTNIDSSIPAGQGYTFYSRRSSVTTASSSSSSLRSSRYDEPLPSPIQKPKKLPIGLGLGLPDGTLHRAFRAPGYTLNNNNDINEPFPSPIARPENLESSPVGLGLGLPSGVQRVALRRTALIGLGIYFDSLVGDSGDNGSESGTSGEPEEIGMEMEERDLGEINHLTSPPIVPTRRPSPLREEMLLSSEDEDEDSRTFPMFSPTISGPITPPPAPRIPAFEGSSPSILSTTFYEEQPSGLGLGLGIDFIGDESTITIASSTPSLSPKIPSLDSNPNYSINPPRSPRTPFTFQPFSPISLEEPPFDTLSDEQDEEEQDITEAIINIRTPLPLRQPSFMPHYPNLSEQHSVYHLPSDLLISPELTLASPRGRSLIYETMPRGY